MPKVGTLLELDRELIARGELWRLFTGHWTHCSLNHLCWDVSCFMLLALLCAKKSMKGFIMILGIASPIISVAVIWQCQEISSYRGLSGIDTALFVFFVLFCLKHAFIAGERLPTALFILLLGGLAGKILCELYGGVTLFCRPGDFIPVPVAHMTGIIVGFAVFVFLALFRPPMKEKGAAKKTTKVTDSKLHTKLFGLITFLCAL